MKTAAQALVAASAFAAAYAQTTGPIIQSPASLVVCQPALLSFSGGQAPYFISVLPGGQSTAAALEQFPQQSGNSFTWNVNLAAGQSITLAIRDSTGAINYSSELSIQAGSDTSCIGSSVSGSGSSTPGGASTTGASVSTGSSGSMVRTTSSSAASSSAASSSAASSTSTNRAQSATSAAASGASSVASAGVSGASSVAAQVTSAVTGAASAKYIANAAGVVGVAALVAFFA